MKETNINGAIIFIGDNLQLPKLQGCPYAE